MGRHYKIILSFILAIFMMTNTIFAYESNGLNLISTNYLFKEIISTKFGELTLYNLQSVNRVNLNKMIVDELITKVKYLQTFPNSMSRNTSIIVDNQNMAKEEIEAKEVMSLNDDQLNLLSRLVAAEARGESYEGQVAVAAVVLNRVKDSRFPDSIEGVIYQKNAFSVVKDGYINAQPTEESYKAAKDALYGSDPTNDAIYFWNPDISTCSWINTLNPYLRIGNHVFAR